MPAVYAAIAQDEPRNNLIFDDVLKALEAKRPPVVLTERRDQLEYLERRFSRFVRNLVVPRGGMSAAERKVYEAALRVADNQETPRAFSRRNGLPAGGERGRRRFVRRRTQRDAAGRTPWRAGAFHDHGVEVRS